MRAHCAPRTQAIFKIPAQIELKKPQVLVSEMMGLTLLKFSFFHFVPYAITNNDLKKINKKNLKTSYTGLPPPKVWCCVGETQEVLQGGVATKILRRFLRRAL